MAAFCSRSSSNGSRAKQWLAVSRVDSSFRDSWWRVVASGELDVFVSWCISCSVCTDVLSVLIKGRSSGEKVRICATVLIKL